MEMVSSRENGKQAMWKDEVEEENGKQATQRKEVEEEKENGEKERKWSTAKKISFPWIHNP